MADLHRIASQVEIYLERVLPRLEPGGGIPETPMNRKERGDSRPPVPEHVMDLWDANPQAGEINAVLTQAARMKESQEIEGRAVWRILGDVLFDHTAIRTWKAEGGVNERRFWMLCLLLASRLSIKHSTPKSPYTLRVYSSPEDAQERQKTQEARKRDTAHTDRRIVRRVEALEASGLGREEAKKRLTEDPENTWSYWRVDRAIVSVNRQRRSERGVA